MEKKGRVGKKGKRQGSKLEKERRKGEGGKGKGVRRKGEERRKMGKGGILCSRDFPLGKTLDDMTAYTHRWVRVKPAHYFCDYILDG